MKRLFLFLSCLPLLLFGSFSDEDDPLHYCHVNVITGHLDLQFDDLQLKSPIPFRLTRNYTSTGALERTADDFDLKLKEFRNSPWMLQGGWSLLPHAHMFYQSNGSKKKLYLCEKNSGHLVPYVRTGKGRHSVHFHPKNQSTRSSGNLSSRKALRNNRLALRHNKAELHLPDGGLRKYKRAYEWHNDEIDPESFWNLTKEILPSGHRIIYLYGSSSLKRIELQNPKGNKVFAWIEFDDSKFEHDQTLSLKTSDGQTAKYTIGPAFKERTYLDHIKTNIRPAEQIFYQPGRKGIGARLDSVYIGGKEEIHVEYYQPSTKKKEKKWAKKNKPHQLGDKIYSVSLIDPNSGQRSTYAHFYYTKKKTEVRDYEGNRTEYYHKDGNIFSIRKYAPGDQLQSATYFQWNKGKLTDKILLNGDNKTIFRKTFLYNEEGDVVGEKWTDFTGDPKETIRYMVPREDRLIIKEWESDGPTHEYEYLPKTDLPTKSLTLDGSRIVQREFYLYDEDHLLVGKIADDGNARELENLSGVTHRKIERFTLHPETGLVVAHSIHFWDPSSNREIHHQTLHYTYNEKRQVIAERSVFDGGKTEFTTHTTYDQYGRITGQTTPTGRVNQFVYNEHGNLIQSKEVGKQQKRFEYNHGNKPTRCIEGKKVTESYFDLRGRLIEHKDHLGRKINQKYNTFGKCIETHLPTAQKVDGTPYTPIIRCSYDGEGNLCENQNPLGQTTKTEYDALQNPIRIIDPEGTETLHRYNAHGKILVTILPDGTEEHYSYDFFQRLTSRKIYPKGSTDPIQTEQWIYDNLFLRSYTDPQGLVTTYEYDYFGRKIAEKCLDRETRFTYDHMGNLERITQNGHSKIQKYNFEREIVEQWEEDHEGTIENYIAYTYNEEGQKIQAERHTSAGKAIDLFSYDQEGRLTKHTDPEGSTTQFIFEEIPNSIGQLVERKTTIDPLGNKTLETLDANGKTETVEKQDPDGAQVAFEQHFYDAAGNQVKRVVHIYQDEAPHTIYTTEWKYNARGLPVEEIEEGEKRTQYTYDTRGKVVEKTLPNGISLLYQYDALNRMTSLRSSDGSVHYTYEYQKGASPTKAHDHIQKLSWQRTYNIFGELSVEIAPNNNKTTWQYDQQGRCTQITLPDQSSIRYKYNDLHMLAVGRFTKDTALLYDHQYTQFDPNGHIEEEQLIKDLGTIQTTHDLLERPLSQQTPWNTLTQEYGPSGLITLIDNSFFSPKEYSYDPLNQLTQEGEETHSFDSIGNPTNCDVNNLNQITRKGHIRFTYDKNGNLIKRSDPETTYQYDALNRLIAIQDPTTTTRYLYDPFSRPYAKENSTQKHYYLYDQDTEIGTLNNQTQLQELKVTGLGISGEIGATIAIELHDQVYAPLHDLSGNIIGLIDTSTAEPIETTDIDAFGRKTLQTNSSNPWRFQSKRTEAHLIFFGKRFYDPALGRWLNPDPAGFIDGPNLYRYVRNSPRNRLDLFGLYSEDFETEFPIPTIPMDEVTHLWGTCQFGEIETDWLIQSSSLTKLNFTEEELDKGSYDLLHHLHEILPNEGTCIGLVSHQNGITSTKEDLFNNVQAIAENIPGDTLIIGIYTPSQGLVKDVLHTLAEKNRSYETPEVKLARQTTEVVSETISKINPDLLWLQINHSRGCVINTYAQEGLNDEQKKVLEKQMLWSGVAPAEPMKAANMRDSVNFYSSGDGITGLFGTRFFKKDEKNDPKIYNIEFVKAVENRIPVGLTEHNFLNRTHQEELKNKIRDYGGRYKFHDKSR